MSGSRFGIAATFAMVAALVFAQPLAAQNTPTCGGLPATMIGTQGDDVLNGTAGNDVIVGLGGNDIIRGFDGRDVLCGGAGRDRLFGGRQQDTLYGGDNPDLLKGAAGADLLFGERGNDRLIGGNGDDELDGGRGNVDRLSGRGGFDVCLDGKSTTRFDTCETTIENVQQVVPTATEGLQAIVAPTETTVVTMGDFLTFVLMDVHRYWISTLTQAGLPAPGVFYNWVTRGQYVVHGCGGIWTPQDKAAYCPDDDTIYMNVQFAYDFWQSGFDGNSPVPLGDMGVAYIVAHEYAHNVQHELGIYEIYASQFATEAPLELQADCWAGTWANSAYLQGILEAGDIEEAVNAAFIGGSFELQHPRHHGTPAQRSNAFLLGYNTGKPSECDPYTLPYLPS